MPEKKLLDDSVSHMRQSELLRWEMSRDCEGYTSYEHVINSNKLLSMMIIVATTN